MASNCHGVEPIGSVQQWSKAECKTAHGHRPAVGLSDLKVIQSEYGWRGLNGPDPVHRTAYSVLASGGGRCFQLHIWSTLPCTMQNAWLIQADRFSETSTNGSAGIQTQCCQCVRTTGTLLNVHACISRQLGRPKPSPQSWQTLH